MFDSRIAGENQIDCVNRYGLAPFVRITSPWITGADPIVNWQPYLQRWTYKGWVTVAWATNWISLGAYNYGSAGNPAHFNFENLNLPLGYYYRIIHIVQWTSTGEFGSMTSDYRWTSGHCLLR